MQIFTTVSFIINLGFIGLVLFLVYPKAIERYRERKKLRETQKILDREHFIRRVVLAYLKELQND
jgi:RecB family exonuclease